MPYWLMKSEPDEFSILDLQQKQRARWDGVRNYQARNFLRAMAPGDEFFFYHSSCATPGVAGVGLIIGEAYPDPTALDPDSPYFDAKSSDSANRWSAIDVGFGERFNEVLALSRLKQEPALAELPLVQKASRLSVMPVTEAQWRAIQSLR